MQAIKSAIESRNSIEILRLVRINPTILFEKINDNVLTEILIQMKSQSKYLIDGIIIEDDKIYNNILKSEDVSI